MCGVPGSGKSTWIQQQLKATSDVWCSRDQVRFSLLSDKDEYFEKENLVFETWIKNIQDTLSNSKVENIYIDATHLTQKARNKVLDKLNLNNVDIIPVVFDVSLDICVKQNEQRSGRAVVPRSVVHRMYYSFNKPTFHEKYKYKDIIYVNREE